MAGGLERPPAAWGGAGGGQRAPGQRRRPITRLAAHAPPPSSSAQSPHEVPGHEKQKTAAQHVVGVRPLGRQPRERRRVGRVELHAQGHWGGRVGRAALACGGAERDAGGRRRPQAAACALPPTPRTPPPARVSTKTPREQKKPDRKELKGNDPTVSMYRNWGRGRASCGPRAGTGGHGRAADCAAPNGGAPRWGTGATPRTHYSHLNATVEDSIQQEAVDDLGRGRAWRRWQAGMPQVRRRAIWGAGPRTAPAARRAGAERAAGNPHSAHRSAGRRRRPAHAVDAHHPTHRPPHALAHRPRLELGRRLGILGAQGGGNGLDCVHGGGRRECSVLQRRGLTPRPGVRGAHT